MRDIAPHKEFDMPKPKKTTKKTTTKKTTKRTSKTARKSPKKTTKKVAPVQAAQPIDRLQAVYQADGAPFPETVVAIAPTPVVEKPKRGRPRKTVMPAYAAPSPELAASMNGGGVVVGEISPEKPVAPVVSESQKPTAESDGKVVVMSLASEQETPDTTPAAKSSIKMENGVLVLNVEGDTPQ
jgi:hypothetical protein